MSDLTAASTTGYANGSTVTTGRNGDRWGGHEVGLYKVTLTSSYNATGYTWDPKTFGFQGVVGAVFITPHQTVANFQSATTGFGLRYSFAFDYVNKRIVAFDRTDSDDPSGDDLSTIVLDILVISE